MNIGKCDYTIIPFVAKPNTNGVLDLKPIFTYCIHYKNLCPYQVAYNTTVEE